MPWGRNAPWDGGGIKAGALVGSGLTLPQGKLAGNTAAAPGLEAIGIGAGLRLDETTKELSVVGETFDGFVQTWADLPVDGSVPIGALYIVRESSGTWLLNRKQRGLYQRVDDTGTRATDWQYLGEWLEEHSDANFAIYNASDSTKTLKFALAGLSTGVVATLTILGSATLNDWFDQSVKQGASPNFRVGTFTKSSIGDSIVFTNAGASNKTGYLYTDATYVGLCSGPNLTGNGIYFDNVANSVGIQTSGATRFLVSSTGLNNTVIGATTPAEGRFTTLSATGNLLVGSNIGFNGGVSDAIAYSASSVKVYVGGPERASFSAAGLAVTGNITGTASISGTSIRAMAAIPLVYLDASSDLDTNGFAYITFRDNSTGSYTERGFIGFGSGNGKLQIYSSVSDLELYASATKIATASLTGFSVTGALGASGNVWSGNNNFDVGSGSTDGWYVAPAGYVAHSRNNGVLLDLRRRGSDGNILNFFRDTTQVGSISGTTTSTAYNTSSDARLKTDLGAFALRDIAAPLYSLQLRKYAWDVWLASEDPATRARVAYGVFAQEAQSVCPWMVNYDASSDRYSVNWIALFPNVVAGLQVHETRLDDHETRIAALEAA